MPEIQSGTYVITNIQEPGEVFRPLAEPLAEPLTVTPFPKPVYRLKSGYKAPGKVNVVLCVRANEKLTLKACAVGYRGQAKWKIRPQGHSSCWTTEIRR